MRKLPRGVLVHPKHPRNAQRPEQRGYRNPTHRVHRVVGHAEVGLAYSLHIHVGELQYPLNMVLQPPPNLLVATQSIHIGE